MNDLIRNFFSKEYTRKLYSDFLSAIATCHMEDMIRGGVVVGFSGGADSVMLLLFLLKYREDNDFPIKAVHVNHSIRGEEADRDENFSKEFCKSLGVDFEAVRVDVPALSKEKNVGIEEAARNARYKIFNDIILADSSFSSIAVAHNATDNLETVIFNMMRGAGIIGVSGIKPVRDNVIRPLIYLPKDSITEALTLSGIDFVYDSTNGSSDYSRNYIRNEIIPKLRKISTSPERMATRLSSNLREDGDFILKCAEDFYNNYGKDGIFSLADIVKLEKPVFSRLLMLMCKKSSLPSPERVHIDSVFNLCKSGDFSFDLPGGKSFVSFGGKAFIGDKNQKREEFNFKIFEGINKFSGFGSIIILSKDKNYDCFSNIYKKSIQVKLKFDIINNSLYVRSKKDGDAYKFGNMTKKLKKIFNDRKISLKDRDDIPVFCDSEGIIWVPGFKVRDNLNIGQDWYITVLEPIERIENERYFFIPNHQLQKGMDIT